MAKRTYENGALEVEFTEGEMARLEAVLARPRQKVEGSAQGRRLQMDRFLIDLGAYEGGGDAVKR